MAHTGCKPCGDHGDGLEQLLLRNRSWAAEMREKDPDFFNRLVGQQSPEYLWIGCSDSRVPANQIMGLAPGEVFVQRNVGNQAMHTDMNLMACLEYAVKSLKVKTVILCGHYGCGAVKAALQLPHTTPGLVNCWISDIRECRNQSEQELRGMDAEHQLARLCELNVLRQVFHVATSPVVASAWAEGQELHLYGLIYDLADGQLHKLAGPISGDHGCQLTSGNRSLHEFVLEEQQVHNPTTRCAAAAGTAAANTAGNTGTGASCVKELAAAAAAEANSGSNNSNPGSSIVDNMLQSTPSDLVSMANNISLAESLARHKHWGSSDNLHALAGAANSSGGGCGSNAGCGQAKEAAGRNSPFLQVQCRQ